MLCLVELLQEGKGVDDVECEVWVCPHPPPPHPTQPMDVHLSLFLLHHALPILRTLVIQARILLANLFRLDQFSGPVNPFWLVLGLLCEREKICFVRVPTIGRNK